MDNGTKKLGGVGDAAVKAKTKRGWDEWFTVLDEAGAEAMGQQELDAHLRMHHALSPWWRQMVASAYRREKGRVQRREAPNSFQVGGNKTIAVPLGRLFHAWNDEDTRDRWLPHSTIVIRSVNPGRSMRITWEDGSSSVEISFCAKGAEKSQVSLRHRKLPDAEVAERMQAFWAESLHRLKLRLEAP